MLSNKNIEKNSQPCYIPSKTTVRGFAMKPKAALVFLLIFVSLLMGTNMAFCERSAYLSVCHELVSMARAYEARAEAHNRVAKSYMMQIQNLASFPKNEGTIASMDALFSQYDQNRKLESKFRELYRETAEEAKKCMKSVD